MTNIFTNIFDNIVQCKEALTNSSELLAHLGPGGIDPKVKVVG